MRDLRCLIDPTQSRNRLPSLTSCRSIGKWRNDICGLRKQRVTRTCNGITRKEGCIGQGGSKNSRTVQRLELSRRHVRRIGMNVGLVQRPSVPESKMKGLLIGALSAVIAVWSAPLADAEDAHDEVAAGRDLALLVCSICHVVAADQKFAPRLEQRTPSFEEIANRPNTSAESLRRFVTTTHWDGRTIPMTMPDPMLVEYQISQVINYILSLRKHP